MRSTHRPALRIWIAHDIPAMPPPTIRTLLTAATPSPFTSPEALKVDTGGTSGANRFLQCTPSQSAIIAMRKPDIPRASHRE